MPNLAPSSLEDEPTKDTRAAGLPVPADAHQLAGVIDEARRSARPDRGADVDLRRASADLDRQYATTDVTAGMVKPLARLNPLYARTRAPAPKLPKHKHTGNPPPHPGQYISWPEWQWRWDSEMGEAWFYENGQPTPQRRERIDWLMTLRRR